MNDFFFSSTLFGSEQINQRKAENVEERRKLAQNDRSSIIELQHNLFYKDQEWKCQTSGCNNGVFYN